MNKASEYGFSVRLVVRDGEEMYEARVAELQDVAAFGDSFSEAYESAIEAIDGLREMFAEKGKTLPPPEREETEFSGRVTLRMSKSLHAIVHRRAGSDGVSLNQWIVEAIACRADGAIALNSVFVASQVREARTGATAIRVQPATYLTSSTSGLNLFAIQGVQEATQIISPHFEAIGMKIYG